MTVCFVLGTRPEITKTLGVISSLISNGKLPVRVLFTGQQTNLMLSTIQEFDEMQEVCTEWIGDPNESNYDPDWMLKFRQFFEALDSRLRPELLVGTGDTNSVLVAAETAKNHAIPFLHLEAGIRHDTDKQLEPEEVNRRRISPIATYHFCPSAAQKSNLQNEGIDEDKIFVAGDLSRVSVATTWKQLTSVNSWDGGSIVAEHFDYRKKLCLCTCLLYTSPSPRDRG